MAVPRSSAVGCISFVCSLHWLQSQRVRVPQEYLRNPGHIPDAIVKPISKTLEMLDYQNPRLTSCSFLLALGHLLQAMFTLQIIYKRSYPPILLPELPLGPAQNQSNLIREVQPDVLNYDKDETVVAQGQSLKWLHSPVSLVGAATNWESPRSC